MTYLESFGRYLLFLRSCFRPPDKWMMFWRSLMMEVYKMGNDSFGIVSIISTFIGAVAVIQFGSQLQGSLVPMTILGRIVRDANILEFSPTITALVMAGKIGSNIASEIGTMKVSEQIDALEIMGVNAASYVVLPKIIAALISVPALVTYSMFLANVGGAISCYFSEIVTVDMFIQGLRMDFDPFFITHALTKAFFSAFLIATISAHNGYQTEGGALEVGSASTKAVVQSCISIIFFDYILTQLMLYK
ncbi:MAG: ABC transporter permease [Bacteroidia bacterium]|nr:ABC transporter permease [Bacteroidia bacterium]MCF8427783.1 ABC transporter permease [Bacteroidia bacterium]MCF8447312.1 ABC transporter permease [Bacteroidia bacterium]